jgi:hypothetical protein
MAQIGSVRGRHSTISPGVTPGLQPLMVTSLGRMGTTWLMRLLSEHPGIVAHRRYPYEAKAGRYWMHQLQVLSAPFDRDHSPDPDSVGSDLWRVGANPSYGPALSNEPSLLRWLGRTHVERMATLCLQSIDDFYGLVAEAQNQPHAVYFAEKHLPDQLPDIARALYRGAKEVFLVRDIRDAACSMLAFNAKRGSQSFGRSLVSSDREFVRNLAGDLRVLTESYRVRSRTAHLVRYEDLVRDPEHVLSGILRYAEIDDDVTTVLGMIGRSSEQTDELVSHRTTDDPVASIGRWRRDLPSDLAEECDAAGDLLAEFGYETTPA